MTFRISTLSPYLRELVSSCFNLTCLWTKIDNLLTLVSWVHSIVRVYVKKLLSTKKLAGDILGGGWIISVMHKVWSSWEKPYPLIYCGEKLFLAQFLNITHAKGGRATFVEWLKKIYDSKCHTYPGIQYTNLLWHVLKLCSIGQWLWVNYIPLNIFTAKLHSASYAMNMPPVPS